MARDVAGRINHKVGREVLIEPEARTNDATMYVPGTDGAKMSKSKDNTLDPFADEKTLKKAINKQIVTDATPLEDPKDPDSSVVYQLYKLLVSESDATDMDAKLRAGGYGWGHAKKDLLGALVDGFATERDTFNRYMADRGPRCRAGEGRRKSPRRRRRHRPPPARRPRLLSDLHRVNRAGVACSCCASLPDSRSPRRRS